MFCLNSRNEFVFEFNRIGDKMEQRSDMKQSGADLFFVRS